MKSALIIFALTLMGISNATANQEVLSKAHWSGGTFGEYCKAVQSERRQEPPGDIQIRVDLHLLFNCEYAQMFGVMLQTHKKTLQQLGSNTMGSAMFMGRFIRSVERMYSVNLSGFYQSGAISRAEVEFVALPINTILQEIYKEICNQRTNR